MLTQPQDEMLCRQILLVVDLLLKYLFPLNFNNGNKRKTYY